MVIVVEAVKNIFPCPLALNFFWISDLLKNKQKQRPQIKFLPNIIKDDHLLSFQDNLFFKQLFLESHPTKNSEHGQKRSSQPLNRLEALFCTLHRCKDDIKHGTHTTIGLNKKCPHKAQLFLVAAVITQQALQPRRLLAALYLRNRVPEGGLLG